MYMTRFSDISEEKILEGDKISIETVLNKEVIILGHKIMTSKYNKNNSGKCLYLQIEYQEEKRIIFTGSDVLIKQMDKYGNKCPFISTIKKINRYYTLT